jgi:hypothetical protein
MSTHWKSISSALSSPRICTSVRFSWKSALFSSWMKGSFKGDRGTSRRALSPGNVVDARFDIFTTTD